MQKKKLLIATLCVLCVGLACIFGCAPENSSETQAPESTEEQTQAEEEAQSEGGKALLSLEEYAEQYPLQTESWLQTRPGDRSMGEMEDRWHAFTDAAGLDGIPLACGSCHIANYEELLAEHGNDLNYMTDGQLEVERMGCGVCHEEDLNGEVHANTSYASYFTEDMIELVGEEDAVCGQCHMIFPGNAVVLPENQGMNLYKYGITPDAILKAYKEAYVEHPIELTPEVMETFMHVGVTYQDPDSGAVLYGWDNESA